MIILLGIGIETVQGLKQVDPCLLSIQLHQMATLSGPMGQGSTQKTIQPGIGAGTALFLVQTDLSQWNIHRQNLVV